MSKARTLGNFVSAGNPLSDGTIAASDISGLGTGVATALAVNVGSAGAPVVNGGALGTPSGGTLTSATGLPIATGVSGLGTGVATALAVNVGSAGAAVLNGGALGTPSSGTLTSATGLPLSTGVTGTLSAVNGGTGVANNVAMTVTGSGNFAYTRTLTGTTNVTFPVTGTLATLAGTETLTNKRVNPRVLSATSYTTDTGTSLNIDNLDEFIVTAQAGALKFNNPTGTPVDGQCLLIAVTGTGARALTYDTQFQASTVALPTTTVSTNRLNMGFVWSSATSKWIILGAV